MAQHSTIAYARHRLQGTKSGATLLVAGAAALLTAAIGALTTADSKDGQPVALADSAIAATTAQVAATPLSQDLRELRSASIVVSRDFERRAIEAAQKAAEKKAAEAKKKAEAARKAKIAKSYSLPTSGYRITAEFGQSGRRWARKHTGLDFAAPTGTKVRAVAAGRVVAAGWAGAYGNRIIVRHNDGTETWYCHLSKFGKTGGRVKPGEYIGRVGATGNVTGPHLHFEVRPGGGGPVDPYKWLTKVGLEP